MLDSHAGVFRAPTRHLRHVNISRVAPRVAPCRAPPTRVLSPPPHPNPAPQLVPHGTAVFVRPRRIQRVPTRLRTAGQWHAIDTSPHQHHTPFRTTNVPVCLPHRSREVEGCFLVARFNMAVTTRGDRRAASKAVCALAQVVTSRDQPTVVMIGCTIPQTVVSPCSREFDEAPHLIAKMIKDPAAERF